jgi:hypothetical protein
LESEGEDLGIKALKIFMDYYKNMKNTLGVRQNNYFKLILTKIPIFLVGAC